MTILVVTGASGAGKTASVTELASRGLPSIRCWFFDSIGVPTPAEMERQFGSAEAWQAAATDQWIARLVAESDDETTDVLDGQTRPSFIIEAARKAGASNVRTVVLDCSPGTRRARLAARGHGQLANRRMEAWATYLRREATDRGIPIIDTSPLSVPEVADALEQVLAG